MDVSRPMGDQNGIILSAKCIAYWNRYTSMCVSFKTGFMSFFVGQGFRGHLKL